MRYIKVKAVKQYAKEHKRQASKLFLHSLDVLIEQALNLACSQFNGHRKRLTPDLLPKKRGVK